MASAEKLEESVLYLAATRPALFLGVPLPLAGAILMAAGLVIVLFQNPFYEVVMIPIWMGIRIVVARDYNAANVLLLWLRTAGTGVDGHIWGGSTVSPSPISVPRRGRGMV
jgi:type IV secretion system protein VirB3